MSLCRLTERRIKDHSFIVLNLSNHFILAQRFNSQHTKGGNVTKDCRSELVRHFPCLALYSVTVFVQNTRNIDGKGHNEYKGKGKIDKKKM